MSSPGQRRFIFSQPQTPIGLRQRVARHRDEAISLQTNLNLPPSTLNNILAIPHVQRAAMDLFSNLGLSNYEQQQHQQNRHHPPYIFPFNFEQQPGFNTGNSSDIHPPRSPFNSQLPHAPAAPTHVASNPSPSMSRALIQRESSFGIPYSSSHALATIGSREVIPTFTSASGEHVPMWHGSLQAIQAETHNARIQQQKEQDSGKGTGPAYERHIENYSAWWDAEQFRRQQIEGNFVPIPALPPTVTKVALWLQQGEATRCKRMPRGGEEIENTLLGRSSISQAINALERLRKEWEWRSSDPEVRTKLRDDLRIKAIEDAAKKNEIARIAKAHSLKVSGSSSDSYTADEIRRASLHQLFNRKTDHRCCLALRNRALFLLPCSSFFRGDNLRLLLLSDMFFQDIPNIDRETFNYEGNYTHKHDIEALTFLVNQAKHNGNGRLDEHGIIRHRDVEVCGIGAIAMYLFSVYHIKKKERPCFEPGFGEDDPAEYGTRSWYAIRAFPGSQGDNSEMSYQQHHDIIRGIHQDNDIEVSKVTHCGRLTAVLNARRNGASEAEAKALGGWSESGSYRACYDRALPLKGLLSVAMFNGEHPERHSLLRGLLDPPENLMRSIFPWLEEEEQKYRQRQEEGKISGKKMTDYALTNFLSSLGRFRRILIQDLAVIYTKYPAADIFRYEPFNTAEFQTFSIESKETMANAYHAAQLEMEKYPEHVQVALQSMITTSTFKFEHLESTMSQQLVRIQDTVQNALNEQLVDDLGMKPPKRQKVKTGAAAAATWTPTRLAIEPPSPPPRSTALITTNNCELHSAILPSDHFSTLSAPTPLPSSPPSASTSSTTFRMFQPGTNNVVNVLRAQFTIEQEEAIVGIEHKFGMERVAKHKWKWIVPAARGCKKEEWVPLYDFKENVTLREIWDEFVSGLNGKLSVNQLEDHWDAKWKVGAAQASEYCRRNKLVQLVSQLRSKPGWGTELTFRFLNEKYPIHGGRNPPKMVPKELRTASNFCRWLQETNKKGRKRKLGDGDGQNSGPEEASEIPYPNFSKVLAAASLYP